jgi:nitrogen regulatory protein PII
MKSIFIVYDQAYNMEVADYLDSIGCRGYTMWSDISGRGTRTGDPHEGSHAWPVMNNAMLVMVKDEKVEEILAKLKAMDEETPDLGLRAFVWNIEQHY